MPNPKITISSLEETIEREMTDEEVSLLMESQADAKKVREKIDADVAALNEKKQKAIDKLVSFGLSIDEIRALGLG